MPTCINCLDYYDVRNPHYVCNKKSLAAQVVHMTDTLKEAGMTRHDIAKAIAADERSIMRWRKAETRPSNAHMRALRELAQSVATKGL